MGDPKRYFINKLPDGEMPSSYSESRLRQRVEGIIMSVLQNFKLEMRNTDGGVYVGLAGAAYMFYHISKVGAFASSSQEYLIHALRYLELPLELASQNVKTGHITSKTGFMTGDVGVYAVASVVLRRLGRIQESNDRLHRIVETGNLVKPLNWFSKGGDELFVGRAGFLCAILWARKELGEEIIANSELEILLNIMVESGKQYALATKSPLPLMYHYYDTQYLGAAHGLAGILYVMLSFPDWIEGNPEHRKLLKDTIDALLCFQTPTGNFPCAMDEVRGVRLPEDELVHWCHGAPGMIYLVAKAYLVYKDPKYLESALKCGEITWQKGLLKKGPGICHGVAGSGYVFLILYQMTKDVRHLYRAHQFMNFMYSQEFARARQPDCPFSLFEGLAGTACFAADLLDPENASFPFFNLS